MASSTVAGDAGVVHLRTEESAGVRVAGLARQIGDYVYGRIEFHDPDGLTGLGAMTGITSVDDTEVFIALDQETGRADVANVTGKCGDDVIDGFRCGANAAADGVTTGTIFGCVLEHPAHVALFALQGGVDVSQDESRFGVIERDTVGYGFSLGQGGEAEHRDHQHQDPYQRRCNFNDFVFYSVHFYLLAHH